MDIVDNSAAFYEVIRRKDSQSLVAAKQMPESSWERTYLEVVARCHNIEEHQSLYVVGGGDMLGHWNVNNAVQMDASGFPLFRATVAIPKSAHFLLEFKFAAGDAKGLSDISAHWESGPNRSIHLDESFHSNSFVSFDAGDVSVNPPWFSFFQKYQKKTLFDFPLLSLDFSAFITLSMLPPLQRQYFYISFFLMFPFFLNLKERSWNCCPSVLSQE